MSGGICVQPILRFPFNCGCCPPTWIYIMLLPANLFCYNGLIVEKVLRDNYFQRACILLLPLPW